MADTRAVDALLDALAARPESATVGNPYRGPLGSARRQNLRRYLAAATTNGAVGDFGDAFEGDFTGRCAIALIGEAPGYRGCAVTGIPFTSRQVLCADAGRWGLFAPGAFIVHDDLGRPWAEATATLVWRHLPVALAALAGPPLLWNAFPFHPRPPGPGPLGPALDDPGDPGDPGDPVTLEAAGARAAAGPVGEGNRGLTAAEVAEGGRYLQAALDLVPGVRTIAVGQVAARALARLGISPLAVLRHPSHGGATPFAAQLHRVGAALAGEARSRTTR